MTHFIQLKGTFCLWSSFPNFGGGFLKQQLLKKNGRSRLFGFLGAHTDNDLKDQVTKDYSLFSLFNFVRAFLDSISTSYIHMQVYYFARSTFGMLRQISVCFGRFQYVSLPMFQFFLFLQVSVYIFRFHKLCFDSFGC